MKRVESGGQWTLFCPNEAPGLHEVWGDEFEALYERYEREGRGRKTMEAQKLWYAILEAQIETGNPFMLYKDAANRKLITTICCKDIPDNVPQESPTNRISVPSSLQTFAPKSSSIPHPTRPLFATLPQLPSPPSSRTPTAAKFTTSRSCTMLLKSSLSTLTVSSMSTTTPCRRLESPT